MESPRLSNGRFAAGSSGNPAGRAKGSVKSKRLSFRDTKKINSMLLQAALNGDVEAAKLVLEASKSDGG